MIMKERKVFLGGTCNNSKWREELIPNLTIDYFNPVVDDWTPEFQEEEIKQKEICKYQLYVLTPKMKGVFSIAEVVDSSNKNPNNTILCVLNEYEGERFEDFQLKSLDALKRLVESNGAFVTDNLKSVYEYLNTTEHKNNKYLYTLEYTLGDSSGESYHENHFAKSNYSPEEISKAYKSATELLGFNFVKEVGVECDDYSIPCKYTGKLLEYGILEPSDFGYSEEEWIEHLEDIFEGEHLNYGDLNEDFYDLNREVFVDIFIKIIKLILPDFELTEVITPTDGYLIELVGAGYGLF